MNNKFTTLRLTTDAMLAAMVALLGYVSIDAGTVKVTFETLPILLVAFLLGPLDAVLVGGIGTFIYQILRYGLMYMTPLWILPYVLGGLFCGLVAKLRKYDLNMLQTVIVTVITELIVSAANTGVLYLDSIVNHYYYKGIILGALALRTVIALAIGVVFGLILPTIVKLVEPILKGTKSKAE